MTSRPVPTVDSRYIELRSSGYRPRTLVLYIDSRTGDRSITYTYIYMYVWTYVCQNSSACHAYLMWAELHHCHFVYVPAVLNITTGNGTGTKNVLEWNCALGFEFNIQSSVYGATTVAKVSLFYTWTRCTVSFYSM